MMPLTLAALFLPLVILATLRLTRLITTDWLGEWVIVAPIKRWAVRAVMQKAATVGAAPHELEWLETKATRDDVILWGCAEQTNIWQARLAKGLDCPFCVGYWLGSGVVVLTAAVILWTHEVVIFWWGVLLFTLALNYVVGHVSKKID